MLTTKNGCVSFHNRPQRNINKVPGDIWAGQISLEQVVKADNRDDRNASHVSDLPDAEWEDDGYIGDLQEANAENTSKSPLLSSRKLQLRDVRKG